MSVLKSPLISVKSANVRLFFDAELPDVAAHEQPIEVPRGLRSLSGGDAAALRDHLLRLHPDDRRARFAHPVSERRIERYVREIDWDRSLLIGWHDDGVLRAVVQAHWPDVAWLNGNAELAVSVERAFQRRGIASAMVPLVALAARNRRLPGLYLTARTDNEAVRRLSRRLGVPLRRDGDGVEGFMMLDPHGPLPDWLAASLAAAGLGRRVAHSRAWLRPPH